MNAIFQQLTDNGLKRLFKFALKKSIGQYLKEDLSLEQIEVNRTTGKLEVKKLELNCSLINDILHNNNVPLTVFHGFIEVVQANYSLFSVFSDGLHLEVNNVSLKLGPREIVNSSNYIKRNEIYNTHFNYPDEELLETDEGRLGIDHITNWIEDALLKLKITSNIITVEFINDISVEDTVSMKIQFENVNFAETLDSKATPEQSLSKTIILSNIRVLVGDKTREDEILLISSIKFDLSSDNNAIFVSLDDLHIELHLENINALIRILRGTAATSLRNDRDDEPDWISNSSLDQSIVSLGESCFFDAQTGPNLDPYVATTSNNLIDSSNFTMNILIKSTTIRVSQNSESLLLTAQNLASETFIDKKDEKSCTKLTLDGINVSRERVDKSTQFISFESGENIALKLSCDLVSLDGGMSVKLIGYSAPVSVSLTNDFTDIWEGFFSNFTEFSQSSDSTNSILEVSVRIPSVTLYILPGDEDYQGWKNAFLCASFWIFHPLERLKWTQTSKSSALNDSCGGLYVDFRDIHVSMQNNHSNLFQKIDINEACFGCYLSSALSDDATISNKCNVFFSNLISVSNAIEISSQSVVDCDSNGDRLYRVDSGNVCVEMNKHQLDTFLAIINMLKRSDAVPTSAVESSPKYRFGFILASKFSSISLCENEIELLDLFMQSNGFMFSNLSEFSSELRQLIDDDGFVRDEPHRFCVAVKNALFELKFFDNNIDVKICANDLLLFEVNAAQHEKLEAFKYDNTLDLSLPRPIVSRTQWQESKLIGEYALNIHLSVETLSNSHAQVRAVQALQVQISLEDFTIEYYPSSVWFLRFVSFFTIHSPQQIIVALDNVVRETVENSNRSAEHGAVLEKWSSVLRKYCDQKNRVEMQPATNYSVELTKVLVTVRNSHVRYFCEETQLVAFGNVDALSLSTAVLSNNSSVNLKVVMEGLKLGLTPNVSQITGNLTFSHALDDDVDLDKIDLLILIDNNNINSCSTVNCSFGNCNINCDIAKLRIMSNFMNSLLICIEESRKSSENIMKKNKRFDETSPLNLYYQHNQDELIDKVRYCDADGEAVAPIIIDSALINFSDEDLEQPLPASDDTCPSTTATERNDWIPDYESPTANCENDSILGSLLDCNDGLSLPAITRPIFRSTKDDESETQFSEYHRHIHEADSVELQELNNIHISTDFEHGSEEISNRLIDEADVMDEIWESKELFGSEENNLSTHNHGNQSESKWYVPANEVEVFHDYIPVTLSDLATENQWAGDKLSLQIHVQGDFNIKIFVGVNNLKSEEHTILQDDKFSSNAKNPESTNVNHNTSSLLIRIRRFIARYVSFSNVDMPTQPAGLNSSLTFVVHDFLLSFENSILGPPHKVLGSWVNATKKRDATKPMVKLNLNGYGSHSLEYRMQLELLPIRCYLDHNFVCCVKYFTTFLNQNDSRSETKVSPVDIYFQAVITNAFDVKVDYRATYLNVAALRSGDFTELLNVFPIDCLELTLKSAHFHGISGVENLGKMLMESWVKDIYENQLHKIISGTTPFKGISQIGSNLHNLFFIPMNELRTNKDVMRHITKSTKGLITTIARESLDVSHKFTKFVADTITDLANDETVATIQHSQRKKNALDDIKRQPKNLSEGLVKAYSSVQRECSDTLETIIAVPVHQYVRNGPKGVATTIARLLPVAVLKPIGGIVEGLSYTLLGLRNNVDPNSLQSDEDIWNVEFDFEVPH